MDLATHRARLVEQCRRTEGVSSLVLFGSATEQAADRRDEWSDLDFNLFLRPEHADQLRASWDFIPDRECVVLSAREYADGGVLIYDDGMVYEFGAGMPWQIADPRREVVLDGGDLTFVDPPGEPEPGNEIRLFIAKLYLGVGRVRRGERSSGGTLIRTYALGCLAAVLRSRIEPESVVPQADRSPFDPLRRLEVAYPILGGQIAEALDRPAEETASRLLALAREHLEPGWPDFPTEAADLVADRFGWSRAR
ncbi:MAG TPA: hypothetical protein P5181_12875 [Dermatophilaceae bacterium]|nr:hypothetical protein [Dermatophilaceae bacterium]